jgi:CheY-like chemotaxis protein
MPTTASVALKDDEIYALSNKGGRELNSAGTSLSAAELQVLVLIDGFSSVAQIAQRVPSVSREEVDATLRRLAEAKLVISVTEVDAMTTGFSTIAIPAGFFSGVTAEANSEADGGVSILKKKGYYVRIARRPGEARAAKEGWKPTILVIDDDPDLQKLIRTYLTMEGLIARAALKRDDIVIALRKQPAPDLVLLDVQLPDANGFDILARMRQHPVLKLMPVIMLTGETTREAVLKGLQGGADGYVTKPFEPDLLISAVKAVLGLSTPPENKK